MTSLATQTGSVRTEQRRKDASWSSPALVLSAVMALVRRDVLLLLRRPSRIAATILTPALLWAFFAGGFSDTVAASSGFGGDAYALSLAAGAALLVVTFASIFGSLGLIRDRESGYLQAVLVGPTPRWAVLSARVASGSLFAFFQASTMLLAAVVLTGAVGPMEIATSGLMLGLTAVGLSGCCIALAWRFRSIEGFHGIMAGVLLPAWLLSGAVFPPGSSGGVMALIMLFNPLAYAHGSIAGGLGSVPPDLTDTLATVVFGLAGFALATTTTRGDAKR